MIAPLPPDEEARLAALRRYEILDTGDEEVYDNITRLAAHLCGTTISLITLLDADRQWLKSRTGTDERESPRDTSFCAHALLERGVTVAQDTTVDSRFADNPFVTGPAQVRFYAGAPLVTSDGHVLGTLCVLDRRPRPLALDQMEALLALARHVVCHMELRRAVAGQALILSALDRARRTAAHGTAGGEAYQAVRARAGVYVYQTVPDRAYLSTDQALSQFLGGAAAPDQAINLNDI
jgi:GAF domain-containing protein